MATDGGAGSARLAAGSGHGGKSPALAWILSLGLPGAGQLYCGKVKRGLWTMAVSAAAIGGAWFLYGGAAGRLEQLLGLAIRIGAAMYVFAFLDAYFTAREINDGTDARIVKNPRVAAVLNLLTRGFGYFYLGDRKKGVVFFILLGAASKAALNLKGPAADWLGLALEVVSAVIAVDAYRMARARLAAASASAHGEPVAYHSSPRHSGRGAAPGLFNPALDPAALGIPSAHPVGPAALHPTGAFGALGPIGGSLPAAVPLGLAGLLALGYCGLAIIGSGMPDYDVIDQARATVRAEASEKIYTNDAYRIAMRVPSHWDFDRSDPGYFIEAVTADHTCKVGLMAEATLPFVPPKKTADELIAQVLAENANFRLVGREDSSMAGLEAHDVRFSADVEGTEVVQTYSLAQRGSSLYVLVQTMASISEPICGRDVRSIRERLTIAP